MSNTKTDTQMQLEQQNLKKQLQQVKINEDMAAWMEEQQKKEQSRVANLEEAAEKARPIFNKVEEDIKNMVEVKGQESYKEYNTSIMTLFGNLMTWHKAIVVNKTLSRAGSALLSIEFGTAEHNISANQLITGVKQIVHQATTSICPPPTPTVRYDIAIDKDGKLNTDVIVNGKPSSGDTKAVFDQSFSAWLDQSTNGEWTLNNKNIITNSNGKPMEMADLKALNRDDRTDLATFFRKQLNFKITPSMQSQLDDSDSYSLPKP